MPLHGLIRRVTLDHQEYCHETLRYLDRVDLVSFTPYLQQGTSPYWIRVVPELPIDMRLLILAEIGLEGRFYLIHATLFFYNVNKM